MKCRFFDTTDAISSNFANLKRKSDKFNSSSSNSSSTGSSSSSSSSTGSSSSKNSSSSSTTSAPNVIIKQEIKPEEEQKQGDRRYGSFLSATIAKDIQQVFRCQNKQRAQNSPRHVPIYLSISEDGTNLDHKGKTTCCPLLLEILNDLDGDDEDELPTLIGLPPVFDTSQQVLDSIQEKRGCRISWMSKLRSKKAKNDTHFLFLEKVIRTLNDLSECGFLMRIGFHHDNYEEVIAHPIIVMLPGDNQMQNYWTSTNSLMNGMKCRVCNETNVLRFSPTTKTWEYRDSKRLEFLCKSCQEIDDSLYNDAVRHKRKQKNTKILSPEQKAIKVEAKRQNVVPGHHIFHTTGRQLHDLWGLGYAGLHMMAPCDELHTLLKGPVENAICWSVNSIYLLQQINPDEYKHLMSNIDKCIINFPNGINAPVPLVKRSRGISVLVTQKRSRKASADRGTGMGSNNTRASEMPGLP